MKESLNFNAMCHWQTRHHKPRESLRLRSTKEHEDLRRSGSETSDLLHLRRYVTFDDYCQKGDTQRDKNISRATHLGNTNVAELRDDNLQ